MANDPELEINKMLTVSTAHLTADEGANLMRCFDHAVYPYLYGYFVYVCNEMVQCWLDDDDSFHNELSEMSEGFREIYKLANEAGCRYIQFDRDGETLNGVASYEW